LALAISPRLTPLSEAGFLLMAAAALFKIGAVPLHFWLPDVYEASDPEVAAFFSTGVKAAAVLLLAKLSQLGVVPYLPWIGAVTALYGAVMGLRQRSLQRLLAYSSISHAGLLILASGTSLGGSTTLIFYLAVYLVMSAGAFLWVGESGCVERADLRGHAAAHPASAAVLTVLLLSLAGIPPLGGFFAKFLVFWDAVRSEAYGPALLAGLSSLIALGYYLGMIRDMYFEENSGKSSGASAGAVPAVCAAAAIFFAGGLWLWR
jgi:NADH-quinone oxidoreductase subunit N